MFGTVKQLAATVLALILGITQAQTRQRFELLEVGVFHGQDVSLDQPTKWVGIYCKDNACVARPTTIKSTRVPDPLGEDDPQNPSGTSIETSSRGQPVFLVRGISASQRTIMTVLNTEVNLQAGDSHDFNLSNVGYTLRVQGKRTPDDPLPRNSRLVFTNGVIDQQLFSLPNGGNDPYITVLWIGDLDGDGKPDLYINASDHYNVSNKTLWLSSIAKPGQLLGKAAVLRTVGC